MRLFFFTLKKKKQALVCRGWHKKRAWTNFSIYSDLFHVLKKPEKDQKSSDSASKMIMNANFVTFLPSMVTFSGKKKALVPSYLRWDPFFWNTCNGKEWCSGVPNVLVTREKQFSLCSCSADSWLHREERGKQIWRRRKLNNSDYYLERSGLSLRLFIF